MSIGTVKEIKTTDKGGKKITVSTDKGDWYLFLDRNLNLALLSPGKKIDFKWEKKGNQNGQKGFNVMTAFTLVNDAPKASQGQTGLSEPELRLISNIVAAAITAGKCDAASQVKIWVLAADEALKALVRKSTQTQEQDFEDGFEPINAPSNDKASDAWTPY